MRVCSLTWYLRNNLEKRTRMSLTAYCFLTQFFLSCHHLHLLSALPGASRRMGGVWGATHSSTLAWKIPWTEEPGGLPSMGSPRVGHDRDFTFTFHFPALEKEMAPHSSALAWRIPGTGEPGGLPSMGSHRVRHD